MTDYASERVVPLDGYGDGYLDHQAREAIRALIRRYGFENARERIAEIIITEANR